MSKKKLQLNIVLAGVGGQGTLVAGKLLGLLAGSLGLDCKISEVHGMSQRGGSVITYVRIGETVASPVIEPGTADFILAFEELEALRWAYLLKKGGTLLINTNRTLPMTVAMGEAEYPNCAGRGQEKPQSLVLTHWRWPGRRAAHGPSTWS
jgi:indolepyruvate ferredoxin oxidoreductase beta subunit